MSCPSPASNPRIRRGVVTRFNPTTWWGRIKLDEGRSIDFHGTSYRGMTPRHAPAAKQPVLVIFSDETRERLLSVEAVPTVEKGACPA